MGDHPLGLNKSMSKHHSFLLCKIENVGSSYSHVAFRLRAVTGHNRRACLLALFIGVTISLVASGVGAQTFLPP